MKENIVIFVYKKQKNMDAVDKLASRVEGDADFKRPLHALACFSETETGRRLGILAAHFTLSRVEKSSITFLQLLRPLESDQGEEEPITMTSDVYQNKLFTSIIERREKGRVTIRAFVKRSDDWLSEILNLSKEQECNMVLLGIGCHRLSPGLCQRYFRLKSDPTRTEHYVLSQFQPFEAHILSNISSFMNRNPVASGLLLDQGLGSLSKIFVPILCPADVQVLPYVLFRFAEKEPIELMVWDAIGILTSDSKVQKFYQLIGKKIEGKVMQWDGDLKIDRAFIQRQDLVIMGASGWTKLLAAGLPWIDALPSVLILKDNIL